MYFSRPIRFSRTLVCGLFKNLWYSWMQAVFQRPSPHSPRGFAAKTLFRVRLQYRQLRRLGPVYRDKSLTMCSSDFVFRKYKQHSAFSVSGVLQLAKTGPLVTINFPLLPLLPLDAMMPWRLYTHYDVKRTNLHILTARGMLHILTRIGQLWSWSKNSYALVRSPNSKITNQRIIDFNNLE